MNEWDKRIREHRVWADMQNLGKATDVVSKIEDLAPESLAGLERIRAILAYCGKRIAAADPLITTPGPLEAVATAVDAMRNELVAFESDKNVSRISAANILGDQALTAVSQVPGGV
jgi:hypothetical protein